jgi:hypothetical protein
MSEFEKKKLESDFRNFTSKNFERPGRLPQSGSNPVLCARAVWQDMRNTKTDLTTCPSGPIRYWRSTIWYITACCTKISSVLMHDLIHYEVHPLSYPYPV